MTMSKRLRSSHSPLFRAKGTTDAAKGEKTLAELSTLHDVNANQIIDRKNQLLERAVSAVSGGAVGGLGGAARQNRTTRLAA
jgi:transposase-like protein